MKKYLLRTSPLWVNPSRMSSSLLRAELLCVMLLFFIPMVTHFYVGETVQSFDDLVEKDGIFYRKSSAYPFTGRVHSQQVKGDFVQGKQEGRWETYHSNGNLRSKGHFKNNEIQGLWEDYHKNGQIWRKGHLQNGECEGFWEIYHDNGQLWQRGHYQDGKREGLWEYFHANGQLEQKGHYKNGKWEGHWDTYSHKGHSSGHLLYKNGVPHKVAP